MEEIRLRLIFKNPHILSELQKSEGLEHSWFLLKQQHKTIFDLSSNILHSFQLHHSCPYGLVLSMDGFVLPPYESTCILKDKDVVSVKMKRGVSKQKKVTDPVNKDVDNNKEGAEISKVNDNITGMKKDNKLQENGVANVEATPKPDGVNKGPNRSSGRTYTKAELHKILKEIVASESE